MAKFWQTLEPSRNKKKAAPDPQLLFNQKIDKQLSTISSVYFLSPTFLDCDTKKYKKITV